MPKVQKYFTETENEIDRELWRGFVRNHRNGNIFQTPVMYDVYKRSEKLEPVVLCVFNESNEIAGILLSVIQKEFNGTTGNLSARSIVIGGPLIKDDSQEILSVIISEYNKEVKNKAIYSQFRNLWDWNKKQKDLFIENGYVLEDHLDIIININQTEAELWEKFSRDRKKSIRKSQSFLQIRLIEASENIEVIYDLLKGVYERIRLPLPDKSFFFNAGILLREGESLKVFGAYKDNILIGVRLVLCYKEMIYDWYAGSDENYLEFRPNDALSWAVLKWGIDNEFNIFDFGGAGKPGVPYGVRDYKMKFGGNPINFGRFVMIHKPLLFIIGKIGLFIYKKTYDIFK